MEFTIKSQRFVPATRLTLARVAWMGKWARRAGWNDLASTPIPDGEASAQQLMQELAGRAFDADAVVPLLVGGYERAGEPWTEAQAAENMALLSEWEDPRALEAIAEVLVSFLMRVPPLWRATLRCLSSRNGRDSNAGPRLESPDPSPPTSTVESSTLSPGSSPAMTSSASG